MNNLNFFHITKGSNNYSNVKGLDLSYKAMANNHYQLYGAI